MQTSPHRQNNKFCTCGRRVGFPALATCFTSSSNDFKRRLDAQEVQNLLFEELDPCEKNHTALVLLPQLIQAPAQRAHLRREHERDEWHRQQPQDKCDAELRKINERHHSPYLCSSHPFRAESENRRGGGWVVCRKLEVEHQRR